jgi:uncharacterized protein
MSSFERRYLVASLCSTLILASCGSANPKLYTIAPVPGPVFSSGPKVIALRDIGLPRYLVRSEIVRSSENYRIDVMVNDWWGEPLDAMLGRILVQELGDRLPHSTVYRSSGVISGTPDASVELEVQRLDLDANGQLVFIAQAAISFSPHAQLARRNFRILVAPPSTDVTGQVAATSKAVGEMADGIAEMLSRPPAR